MYHQEGNAVRAISVAQLVECSPILHKAQILPAEPDNLRVHICNPITREAKVEPSTDQKHPQLYRVFEASLGYMRTCLNKTNQNTLNKKSKNKVIGSREMYC